MKTLIIKEETGLFGLRQITQRTPDKPKALVGLPRCADLRQHGPGSCNIRTKNAIRRVTKKQMYRSLLELKTELEIYISGDAFEEGLTFGYFLNQYIRRQNKLDKQFAVDIGVTHAAISQYLNDHRKPTKEFLVRIELHSNNLIPAIVWFKLVQKEKENEIITNSDIRMAESRYVKSTLFSGETSKLKVFRNTTCNNIHNNANQIKLLSDKNQPLPKGEQAHKNRLVL